MKNLLLLISGVLIVAGEPPATQTSPKEGCLCMENTKAQTPCATRGRSTTDKELAASREIQKRIDLTVAADKAKDVSAATRFNTSDFTVTNLDGTTENLKDVKAGIQKGYDYYLVVSDKTSIQIDCLTLDGDNATIYINQHFVRTIPDKTGGPPHELITNITHRELWVLTADGWMRKHIDELQRGPRFVDGQPLPAK